MAIAYSDAVVFHGCEPDEELVRYCEELGKPWKQFDGEGDHVEEYDALYKSLMSES